MGQTQRCRTFHHRIRTEEYTSVSTAHGIISRIFVRIGFILSHGITINKVNHTKYGLWHPNHVNWNQQREENLKNAICVKLNNILKCPMRQRITHRRNENIFWDESSWKHKVAGHQIQQKMSPHIFKLMLNESSPILGKS